MKSKSSCDSHISRQTLQLQQTFLEGIKTLTTKSKFPRRKIELVVTHLYISTYGTKRNEVPKLSANK